MRTATCVGLSVLLIALLVLLCFFVAQSEDNPVPCIEASGRFVVVEERTTYNTVYVEMYDKFTRVMYVYIKLSDSGSISVLYDANGLPLLYEGDPK